MCTYKNEVGEDVDVFFRSSAHAVDVANGREAIVAVRKNAKHIFTKAYLDKFIV
jgi:hypothetical protein